MQMIDCSYGWSNTLTRLRLNSNNKCDIYENRRKKSIKKNRIRQNLRLVFFFFRFLYVDDEYNSHRNSISMMMNLIVKCLRVFFIDCCWYLIRLNLFNWRRTHTDDRKK